MKRRLAFAISSFFVAVLVFAAPPNEEGKSIFLSRCASCHNVNKILVGPALANVDQRHNMDWIVHFVQSSQTVIKGGDKEATALFAKFNNIPMPDHKDLSPENIKSIVAYIKSETSTTTDKAPFARPFKLRPAYQPLSINNVFFFGGLFFLIALLVVVLLFFVRVKEFERARYNTAVQNKS